MAVLLVLNLRRFPLRDTRNANKIVVVKSEGKLCMS